MVGRDYQSTLLPFDHNLKPKISLFQMVRMLCIFGILKQSQGLTILLNVPSMGESNMDVQGSVQRQR